MTDDGHDHPTPAELRGLPRSSYARSHAVDHPAATELLGHRIRRLRAARGWTQTGLAEAVGTTLVSVAHWEHGRAMPRLALFAALARALGVSMDALWFGEAQQ